MIKVLICDGEGTLQFPSPTAEIHSLVASLGSLGIALAVASNSANKTGIQARFKNAGLPVPSIIVTKQEVDNVPKPSPQFVYKIRDEAKVKLQEIVYLGDSDGTDALCAINARVLPLAAKYSVSGADLKYGIPVNTPGDLATYLSTYAHQDEPYFGWSYVEYCQDTDTFVEAHALFGEHGTMGLTENLKAFLKHQEPVKVGKDSTPFGRILLHYLVSQVYLSGLISNIDWISVYPGHLAGSTNVILERFSEILTRSFRNWFKPDLLVRHSTAKQSRLVSGAERDIYEQFRTIRVNPNYASTIKDKRILVLDDFTTSGNSLETARRMLLQAGARQVVSLAIAKYRNSYGRTIISKSWDPFVACTLGKNDIQLSTGYQDTNSAADQYFYNTIWPVYSK